MTTELEKKGEGKQVNTLIYTMGDEADDILLSRGFATIRRRKE